MSFWKLVVTTNRGSGGQGARATAAPHHWRWPQSGAGGQGDRKGCPYNIRRCESPICGGAVV